MLPQTLLAIWGPRGKNKISMRVFPGPVAPRCLCVYHTFCTSGAFRLDETSYHELKPCKLQWFLHFRTGPPAPSPETVRKSVQKFPQNKTKQNAARMPSGNRPDLTKNQPRFVLFCFVLFCFVLLCFVREIDHSRGFLSQ